MLKIRSPYDRSLADTMFWARLIDKIRLHARGELPDDYSGVLGHKLGTDGQFLGHFGVTFEQVTEAVLGKDDTVLAVWLEGAVDDFPAKKEAWNESNLRGTCHQLGKHVSSLKDADNQSAQRNGGR